MRFNAFNFAGMKKSTIWVLGIVMGLSFLSLLYLQVSYIEEMVKMRKGQFDESVQRSLVQACRNIELVETKKYLEDDAIATEKAAQLSREQSEEKKGEDTDSRCGGWCIPVCQWSIAFDSNKYRKHTRGYTVYDGSSMEQRRPK